MRVCAVSSFVLLVVSIDLVAAVATERGRGGRRELYSLAFLLCGCCVCRCALS